MRKALALLLTGLMVLFAISAVSAQETITDPQSETGKNPIIYDYDELNVAGVTPMTGNFFCSLGNLCKG